MLSLCVCTRAKFIQYIKELGVASSLTYRGIVTFFSRFYPPISMGKGLAWHGNPTHSVLILVLLDMTYYRKLHFIQSILQIAKVSP